MIDAFIIWFLLIVLIFVSMMAGYHIGEGSWLKEERRKK